MKNYVGPKIEVVVRKKGSETEITKKNEYSA